MALAARSVERGPLEQVLLVYAKAAVATRAGATLFAMEHGLLSPGSP